MAGKADYIVNGSFERVSGLDSTAWIALWPGRDFSNDGRDVFNNRPAEPPDGWSLISGLFFVETFAPPQTPSSFDGKVWALTHFETRIAQDVAGLTPGAAYDLALVAYDTAGPGEGPSGLEVWWNGQMVADFDALHADAGRMTHVLLTAGSGANRLELRTSGIVVLDDVRLFAAGASEVADFSQATQPVGANLGDTVFRGVGTTMSALHAYVGGAGQTLNGVRDVIGGSAGDLLVSGAVGGVIEGRDGADALIGASGSDTVLGGGGNDYILGGDGRNYLRGDEGADTVTGGRDFDDINGNMGDDTAAGGDGDDWVVGGKDSDALSGGAGGDLVYGNLGADTCNGDDGADIVRGGQDNDVVGGGAGNDFVSGDKGDDTMSGGAGADVFHTFGDAGLDYVADFHRAEGDRVLLDPGTAYSVGQSGADVIIDMVGGGRMVLAGVSLSSLTGDWIGYG